LQKVKRNKFLIAYYARDGLLVTDILLRAVWHLLTSVVQPSVYNKIISAYSELQLDVRHLNRWRRHLVNAYEVRQAWCLLQVKLCDPCLSAVKWSLPCKALYKCSAFFTFTFEHSI